MAALRVGVFSGLVRPTMRLLTFLTVAILAGTPSLSWAQKMYRCTAAAGNPVLQDKPYEKEMKESVIAIQPDGAAAPVRLRSQADLSKAQREDYFQLLMQTHEVFRVIGRAQACGLKVEVRMKQLFDDLSARHGTDADMVSATAFAGFASGMENRPTELDRDSGPREPTPCPVVAAALPSLKLPRVPESLIMQPGEANEKTSVEEQSPTGPVRVVVRTQPKSGAATTVVLHREKEIFETTNSIDYNRIVRTRTPVLLIATKDRDARCGRYGGYHGWIVITLPASAASKATPLPKIDCLGPTENWLNGVPYLCFQSGSGSGLRSRIYSIDDVGALHEHGDRPPGVCPW